MFASVRASEEISKWPICRGAKVWSGMQLSDRPAGEFMVWLSSRAEAARSWPAQEEPTLPGPASHASKGCAPSELPFSSKWPHKRLIMLLLKMGVDMPLHHMTIRLHMFNICSPAHHI